jgi:hypothetical protein
MLWRCCYSRNLRCAWGQSVHANRQEGMIEGFVTCTEKETSQTSTLLLWSIISGTGAAISSKTNFGPTGHYRPWSSPLLHLCTVPRICAIFTLILEVVFRVGVQHCLWFCLNHLNCVKMAAIQFYLQLEKQRKVSGIQARWVWLVADESHIVFAHSCEKGSVRQCIVIMQQPVLLLPKSGTKSWHIFTWTSQKVTKMSMYLALFFACLNSSVSEFGLFLREDCSFFSGS